MNKTIPMVAVAMLVAASVSLAQAQDGKAHRVGVLSIVDTPVLKGFRDGLKEIGYVEGKNLVLDISIKKTYNELRPIAKLYREQKVDVIVTLGGDEHCQRDDQGDTYRFPVRCGPGGIRISKVSSGAP